MPVLVYARDDEREALDALDAEISPFAKLERLDAQRGPRAVPVAEGRRASRDRRPQRHPPRPACLAAGQFAPASKQAEASSSPAPAPRRSNASGGAWQVTHRARRAHFRRRSLSMRPAPGPTRSRNSPASGRLGSSPNGARSLPSTLRRAPTLEGLPFAKTVGDELYFAPESGRLFASPMDEVPSEPVDAQPDDYEVALAALRMEERTTVKVERIHSKWAGLRTFAPDRHPVAGFAPDAEGFFWLAGQGGFGLQTSPAMARVAASLIAGAAVAGRRRRAGRVKPRALRSFADQVKRDLAARACRGGARTGKCPATCRASSRPPLHRDRELGLRSSAERRCAGMSSGPSSSCS